jgi:hypothetical protein
MSLLTRFSEARSGCPRAALRRMPSRCLPLSASRLARLAWASPLSLGVAHRGAIGSNPMGDGACNDNPASTRCARAPSIIVANSGLSAAPSGVVWTRSMKPSSSARAKPL